MGCGPSRNSLSRVADSTCEYNRCYMKEFDAARRKQKKAPWQSRRRTPTYNNFSSTTKVYDRSSGTSKITVRLSTDGSMLEIEKFDVEYDSAVTSEVADDIDDDQGFVMKSVSELKKQHNCGNLYMRCDSAPLLVSSSSASACRNTKGPACGLASCCIQNRTNSETMSDEYKPKSTSTVEFQNDNDVVVEHRCEIHRDNEPIKTISDDKGLESDSLNDSSPHKDQVPNKHACGNIGTDTTATSKPSSESEPTSVSQKTTIHVKRSSIEQKMRGPYENGHESHLHYTYSTFKPVAKNSLQKIYHSNGERSHNNYCYPSSLCKEKYSTVETTGEISRKYTNSMTLGVNGDGLNKTESFSINNHDSGLENEIVENNQLSIICSCDNDNYISEVCDCYCINCVCGCCQNVTCRWCDATIGDTSNKSYQSESPSTCDGEMNSGMSCCCCFTKHNNNRQNHQQCLVEHHSLIDNQSDKNVDSKTLRSFKCTPEPLIKEEDNEMKSFTTSLEDGHVFQTSYGCNKSDISDSKHTKSSIDFLELRRCREFTSQRPCIPNKTISRELDLHDYLQCLQMSAPDTRDKSEKKCQEDFNILDSVVRVHSELETMNVNNSKPVVMVTNEVPRTSIKDDGRPCINLKRSRNSDRDKCCNHYDEITDIVDNDVFHDTCCCGKRSHIIASEENRVTDYCKDIDDQPMDATDIRSHIIQGKQNSETFPFCEYESFMVKDNQRDYLNDNHASGEISIDCTKPLIRKNNEETSTSEASDTSADDDRDFDDDSSDECRDEYVDALETTYV